MNLLVTVVLVAIGIIGTLFVARPDLIANNPLQKVFVTGLVDEEIHLSSGIHQSYGINTANSKAIHLTIDPKGTDAKVGVKVFYLDNNTKTFEGKKELTYVVNYGLPLDVEIIPEQDSKVVVDLIPFTDCDLKVSINLRYVF